MTTPHNRADRPHERQAEVLLVTTNEAEVRAAFAVVLAATGTAPTWRPIGDHTYYDLGVIGDTRVWLVRSQEGAVTPGGAFATLSSAIGIVRPAAVILVGTATGLDPATQQLGDILIARQVVAYEPQRIGTQPDGTPDVIPRGDRASASTLALDRCNDAALHWPPEQARVRFGLLLSGEKLLEHTPTAAALLAREPEAIGIEQEGVALYTAAHQHKLDWIVIKAVARWPEGAPADILLAARNAAAFAVQMIARGGFAPAAWAASLPSQSPLPPDDQARPGQVAITNQAPNQGPQGVFHGPVIINPQHPAPSTLTRQPPTPTTLTARQRAELLDRLKMRYQELLDHALPHQVRLQLGLHTRPDAVDPAWRRMLLRGPRASSQPVPSGTSPLELFDGQQGQLLVLGAPGAGKTTLIVELAQALTARALADTQARIPVVVNVAAWRNGQSVRDWLAPTLRDLLGASRRFAAQLAASDDLLLLLDGLDEMAADHRTACVAAINAYLGERDLAPPLVVGCRSREYADIDARLAIAGAVELEPLELLVIKQALADVPAAQGVLLTLQTDELLRELATTPLIVNVLLLAHGGQRVPQVEAQTIEQYHTVLWWTYVQRMLERRSIKQCKSVLMWLKWFSRFLSGHNKTDFLIDDLQPAMLRLFGIQFWYDNLITLVFVFIGGSSGLIIASSLNYLHLPAYGLLFGVIVGFIASIFSSRIIYRYDHINLSWLKTKDGRYGYIATRWISLISGLIFAIYGWRISYLFDDAIKKLLIGQFENEISRLIFGLFFGLLGGLIVGAVVGLFGELLEGSPESDLILYTTPMQSIVSSLQTGLIQVIVFTPLVSLVSMMVYTVGLLTAFRLPGVNYPTLLDGLPIALFGGLFIGLFGGLLGGIGTFIQHYTLRLVLSHAGLFPFRAVTFLDAMTDRLLLERDGAFYRFRHLLLRDFIADLSDDDIARLAREIDGEGASR